MSGDLPRRLGTEFTGTAFTSSTSFANPAMTIARRASNTFTGIDPGSVPGSLLAQAIGLGMAVMAIPRLWPGVRHDASLG